VDASSTMQALVLELHNAPFTLKEVTRPTAHAGQVLVRIKASGVNPLDTKIRTGNAPHARVTLPAILGMDLSGIVEAVGPEVTVFKPGDEVYGMTGGVGGLPGSLATFAAVDADLLAIKPANLSMREAAALPLVFITAWEGSLTEQKCRLDKRYWCTPEQAGSVMLPCKSPVLLELKCSQQSPRTK
jgi:NADPH:quinone reductase